MNFSAASVTAGGLPGCQHWDCTRSSRWSYNRDPNAPLSSTTYASTVWAVIGARYENGTRVSTATIVMLCRKHTGTLRSLITRGVRGYNTSEYRLLDVLPVNAANDRAALSVSALRAYNDEIAAAQAARREYIRTNKVRMMNEHLASTYTGTSTPDITPVPDEYGRVFVRHNYRNVTPGGARALAAQLIAAAERAEALMNGGSNV